MNVLQLQFLGLHGPFGEKKGEIRWYPEKIALHLLKTRPTCYRIVKEEE